MEHCVEIANVQKVGEGEIASRRRRSLADAARTMSANGGEAVRRSVSRPLQGVETSPACQQAGRIVMSWTRYGPDDGGLNGHIIRSL